MPYTQEISRQNKACFLFLLDQSYSMTEPLANSQRSKMQELVLAINGWLQNAVIRATGGAGVKDWMDIGVIGYRTDQQANPIVGTALNGALKGRELVSVVDIGEHPSRLADEMQTVPDEATGDLMQVPVQVPVWVEPVAEGGTPMCHTLYMAHGILEKWIAEHKTSFPPIVIHITDGESQDGDPIPYAESVKSLATDDGNVLLFNCHLSMTPADSFLFPHSDEILPDKEARTLFQMSSVLPEPIMQRAVAEHFPVQPGARGMVFNADLVCLLKFLDMGTRVASNLR
jgi:hypothetical protein